MSMDEAISLRVTSTGRAEAAPSRSPRARLVAKACRVRWSPSRAARAESVRMRNRSARGHPQINREVTDVRLLAHHNLAQLGERFV